MHIPSRVASARVTGGVTPVYVTQRGFTASITRSAIGVYVLTLTEECDPAMSVITLGRTSAAHGSIGHTHLSDTQIQINIFDAAAAAADGSFCIAVDRTFA